MAKQYLVKFRDKNIKLWQNDDGSWAADGGLNPAGFTFDPDIPEEQRVYELDYLIAHGSTGQEQARDLLKQTNFLLTQNPLAEETKQNLELLAEKITAGSIDPRNVTIAELEKLLISQKQTSAHLAEQKLIEQDILAVLGLTGLPPAEKKELIEQFSQTIMQSIILRITKELSPDQKEEFMAILAAGNQEKIGQFLPASVPNLNQIATEESLKFKHFLINRSQEVDKKIQLQKMTAPFSH